MKSKRQPYIGYRKDPSEQSDVTKVAELIHRRRRQVAMHSYLYYCLDEITITDLQYEYFVLNLLEVQLRFPQIAESVPFMKRVFMKNDFQATGFHIANYVKVSNSSAAESIKHAAGHLILNHHRHKYPLHQDKDIDKRISRCNERLASLK